MKFILSLQIIIFSGLTSFADNSLILLETSCKMIGSAEDTLSIDIKDPPTKFFKCAIQKNGAFKCYTLEILNDGSEKMVKGSEESFKLTKNSNKITYFRNTRDDFELLMSIDSAEFKTRVSVTDKFMFANRLCTGKILSEAIFKKTLMGMASKDSKK